MAKPIGLCAACTVNTYYSFRENTSSLNMPPFGHLPYVVRVLDVEPAGSSATIVGRAWKPPFVIFDISVPS
jgi:hypothetical protein